jgi:hypothetical protein
VVWHSLLKIQAVRVGRLRRIVHDSTSPRADSEELGMLRSRAVLATFLVAACAACSDGGASPASTVDPLTTTRAPTAPTSSVPPDLAGYSERERAAYAAAVSEYDSFTKRNDHFYSVGQTTLAAKRFYQRYAVDWSTAWGNLAQIANNNVTVTGSTKTIWTKPKSIDVGAPKVDVVVLRRCLDESDRTVTQNGKKLNQPQLKHPHIYTVRLEKHRGEQWWRAGIARQGPTC